MKPFERFDTRVAMLRRFVTLLACLAALSCSEECTDQFDCLKVASKSTLTCDDGRCVVKSTFPAFPSLGPTDAGRGDGGLGGDGGVQPGRVIPGNYVARLTGGQLVPPVTTTANGQLTATLVQSDAGTSLSWAITYANLVPTNAVLVIGAPAGRNGSTFIPLSDGGITSPFSGTLPLSRTQAIEISAFRTSVVLTSATQPLGELRGQLVPRGSLIGFSQFVRASDGRYGGGGQLVVETSGGFIPVAGSFEFNWAESGPVTSASVNQSSEAALLPLPLSATGTSSSGSFEALTLLMKLRDAGISVTGLASDGGEVFRGDLSL
jgi:hypothetical protein